jgi:type VI protein secretion system component Hcp
MARGVQNAKMQKTHVETVVFRYALIRWQIKKIIQKLRKRILLKIAVLWDVTVVW